MPRRPPTEARRLTIRLKGSEMSRLRKVAEIAGLSVSEVVRQYVLAELPEQVTVPAEVAGLADTTLS
jgi:hypothetical protein